MARRQEKDQKDNFNAMALQEMSPEDREALVAEEEEENMEENAPEVNENEQGPSAEDQAFLENPEVGNNEGDSPMDTNPGVTNDEEPATAPMNNENNEEPTATAPNNNNNQSVMDMSSEGAEIAQTENIEQSPFEKLAAKYPGFEAEAYQQVNFSGDVSDSNVVLSPDGDVLPTESRDINPGTVPGTGGWR